MGVGVEEPRGEFVASASGDLIESDEERKGARRAARGFGGRRGRHSDEFHTLWKDMTSTYRDNPGATW
jgi:hypothetical protein